jgi:hypothetical protein
MWDLSRIALLVWNALLLVAVLYLFSVQHPHREDYLLPFGMLFFFALNLVYFLR